MGLSPVATAFILVICAGLATAIGASVVFFPRIANLVNRKSLAASLALSAGVMTYISLVDIYNKSIAGFEEQGHDEGKAFIYASLSFFGGCIIMLLLNWGVGLIVKDDDHHDDFEAVLPPEKPLPFDESSTSSGDSIGQKIDEIHRMADEMETEEEKETSEAIESGVALEKKATTVTDEESDVLSEVKATTVVTDEESYIVSEEMRPVKKMGIAMAIAIAIHNFPEGLVTFVAYMDNPTVGFVLAAGIAIHNIPEGLCVAMPMYYGTGRRWYSFWWGTFSGLTEPLGALIGWAVFSSSFSGNTYGILFGIVSGIMAVLSIDELLPTAHRLDPKNTLVTYFFLIGAFAISLSLMLFSV